MGRKGENEEGGGKGGITGEGGVERIRLMGKGRGRE